MPLDKDNIRRVQVLGIDAGGTMTDTFFVDSDGEFVVGKAQSTPQNEALGLIASAREGLEHWGLKIEDALADIQTGVYSGTAMLNRVVQRKGLRCALIVNAGMEDFHRMGRAIQAYLGFAYEDRIHLNTHYYDEPLVPRHLTRGVMERIDMSGTVVIPLREETARTAARELIAQEVEGIVISLLHSYRNPEHERRVRDIVLEEVAAAGRTIPVFASTDYYPVRKETHRTNTTILEAYAAEPSRQTLQKITAAFKENCSRFDFRVMATHGGTISWKAKELARTIVSGPIGGVIGAKYLGEVLGYANIACSDTRGEFVGAPRRPARPGTGATAASRRSARARPRSPPRPAPPGACPTAVRPRPPRSPWSSAVRTERAAEGVRAGGGPGGGTPEGSGEVVRQGRRRLHRQPDHGSEAVDA